MDNQIKTKCGFVAIVGEPNAGKSTLVNIMVGEKISIVSHKCQTTRRQVKGIAHYENTQVIFIDTPGFFKAKTNLEKALISNFKHAYKDADIILIMIDACQEKNLQYTYSFIEKLENRENQKIAVVINKVDIAHKKNILKIAEKLSHHTFIEHIFMISATKSIGIPEIKNYLRDNLSSSHFLYETDKTTDMNMSFRLSEITREKVYMLLSAELPYNIYIETEMFKETEKKARIYQSIVVLKTSQKGIVLGHKGSKIKEIKEKAIEDMKMLLRKKVELKLFVKVKEDWTNKRTHLQNASIIDY